MINKNQFTQINFEINVINQQFSNEQYNLVDKKCSHYQISNIPCHICIDSKVF